MDLLNLWSVSCSVRDGNQRRKQRITQCQSGKHQLREEKSMRLTIMTDSKHSNTFWLIDDHSTVDLTVVI